MGGEGGVDVVVVSSQVTNSMIASDEQKKTK